MEFIYAEQLVVVRRDADGQTKQPAIDFCAAFFLHSVSRGGDPNLHVHAAIPNAGKTHDGHTGALDILALRDWKHVVNRVFHNRLAERLTRDFGIRAVVTATNLRIDGVPPAALRTFSKRRQVIEGAAHAQGYETHSNPKRAQIAALHTRPPKSSIPAADELEKRWDRELENIGTNRHSLWLGIIEAAHRPRHIPPVDPAPVRMQVYYAIDERMGARPFLYRHELLAGALSAPAATGGAGTILEVVAELVRMGALVQVRNGNRQCYTTSANLGRQARLLDLIHRPGRAPLIPDSWLRAELFHDGVPEHDVMRVAHALGPGLVTAVVCAEGASRLRLVDSIRRGGTLARLATRVWTATARQIVPQKPAASTIDGTMTDTGSETSAAPGRMICVIESAAQASLPGIIRFLDTNGDRIEKLILIDTAAAMAAGAD